MKDQQEKKNESDHLLPNRRRLIVDHLSLLILLPTASLRPCFYRRSLISVEEEERSQIGKAISKKQNNIDQGNNFLNSFVWKENLKFSQNFLHFPELRRRINHSSVWIKTKFERGRGQWRSSLQVKFNDSTNDGWKFEMPRVFAKEVTTILLSDGEKNWKFIFLRWRENKFPFFGKKTFVRFHHSRREERLGTARSARSTEIFLSIENNHNLKTRDFERGRISYGAEIIGNFSIVPER